jgi:putative endonuclease
VGSDRRREIGRRGEDLAARRLERLGYTVIERNYRTRAGEIDLIAERSGTLVFCEVKALVGRRGGASAGPATPAEAVGPAKRIQVRRLARDWLATERERAPGRGWQTLRFDVVAIVLRPDGGVISLEHLENAF